MIISKFRLFNALYWPTASQRHSLWIQLRYYKTRVSDNDMDGKFQNQRTFRQKLKNITVHRRTKYKDKLENLPVTGTLDLHVISSGGPGTPKSVLLSASLVRLVYT